MEIRSTYPIQIIKTHFVSPVQDFKLGLSKEQAEIMEGHFFCSFDQTDHDIDDFMRIEIRNSTYHILLARGKRGSASKCL